MFSRISGLFAEHKLARRPLRSLSSMALAQYWSPFSLRSSKAEAEAIKWALSLASNLNFEAVIVESDFRICASLRSDLEFASPCYIKSIISDSLALLADSLSVLVY
ncbi:hypothetical protein SO802_017800 [Lithocarpus litseifolius]|uniref:RNase H type-1 domain-containing protein n=1 Tax=Lithocarpus litseifolius TaxID=425828 RepID=A0AAW2CKX9_9ROSI